MKYWFVGLWVVMGCSVGCTAINPGCFDDGGACLDAAEDLAAPCLASLSGVGLGDFTVLLTVTATPQPARFQPFVDQRPCGVSLDDPWWEIGMAPDGTVLAQTSGPRTAYTEVYSLAHVDDRVLHRIRVQRAAGVLSVAIDGLIDAAVPSGSDLSVLPPLRIEDQCAFGMAVGVAVGDLCLLDRLVP